jgi:hypothetical protein
MKARTALALAAMLLLVFVPSKTSAFDPYAGLEPVLTAPSYAGCSNAYYAWLETGPCEDLVSEPMEGWAFLWVVMTEMLGFPQGLGGIQFGIEYGPGVSVNGWTLCTGGSETSEDGWPASGMGNAVTWPVGCYEPPDTNAKIGYLVLEDGSAYDFVAITGDPRIGRAAYADCLPETYVICPPKLNCILLSDGGAPLCHSVDCGGPPPDCEPPTPAKEATWGGVKTLYH